MALSAKDLQEIEKIVTGTINDVTGEINKRISYLPTKEEFYSRMDEVMGELKNMREELVIVNGRSSENRDRIEKLESIHPKGRHAASA